MRAWWTAAFAAPLFLAACGGADPVSSAATAETGSPGSSSPAATESSGDQEKTFAQASPVWWSGFEIALTSGTYSAAEHQLTLEAQVTNTAAIDTDLASTRSSIAVSSGGQLIALGSGTAPIPHGATTANTFTFANLPDEFVLADAELVLGDADQHQAVLPLDGSTPTAPAPVEVPGALTIAEPHTGATYAVSSVRLLPAACSGSNPVDIQYVPLRADNLVLELVGTLSSASASVGGVAVQSARATPVSAVSAIAEPGLNDVLGIANPPRTDLHLCFAIPADTHGAVTVQFDTRLVGEEFVVASGAVTLP